MRSAALLGVACLAVLSTAQAEVRLVRSAGAPRVQVTPTLSGPWTPVGGIDARTLNPAGDVRQDGAPSHAVNGRRAIAAWFSPDAEQLRCSVGTPDEGWGATHSLEAHADGRVPPAVVALRDGWVLAWSDTVSGLSVAAVSADGRVLQTSLGVTGSLRSVVVIGDVIEIVVGDAAGLTAYTFLPLPLPDPIVFRQMRTTHLGQWAGGSARLPVATSRANAGTVQTARFRHPDNSVGTALVWWTSTTSLSYIELTEDGPVLPVRSLTANGNGAKYPQSLVNEALRDLGR